MQTEILKYRSYQILLRVWESMYKSIGWTVKTPIERKWNWKHLRWFYEMEIQKEPDKVVRTFRNNRSKDNTKKMTFHYRDDEGVFYEKVYFVNPKTFDFNTEFKKWCNAIK